jgi:hypothetical protein
MRESSGTRSCPGARGVVAGPHGCTNIDPMTVVSNYQRTSNIVSIQCCIGSPLIKPTGGGLGASLSFARSIPGCEATGEGLNGHDWLLALLPTNQNVVNRRRSQLTSHCLKQKFDTLSDLLETLRIDRNQWSGRMSFPFRRFVFWRFVRINISRPPRAELIIAIEDILRNTPRRSPVDEVALASDVAKAFRPLQRHDLFKDLRQLFGSAELHKYPRLVAKHFSSEKPGPIGSLQGWINQSQRFFRITKTIQVQTYLRDERANIVRISLYHFIQELQRFLKPAGVCQKPLKTPRQRIMIIIVRRLQPLCDNLDRAIKPHLSPQSIDPTQNPLERIDRWHHVVLPTCQLFRMNLLSASTRTNKELSQAGAFRTGCNG